MGQFPGVKLDSLVGSKPRLGTRALQIADACQGAGRRPALLIAGLWSSGLGFTALAQPEAFAVHFEDMHVMGQAVQNGAREAL